MQSIGAIIFGYLMGCINFAYIIGKLNQNIDIRDHGSGNLGTTNAIRIMGWKFGAITFLGDFLKSLLAYIIMAAIFKDESIGFLAGFSAVMGHNWPVFLKFKGGKGIASTLGLIMAVNPMAGLISIITMAVLIYFTRYVSVGSIAMAVMIPVLFFVYKPGVAIFPILGTVLMVIAVFRHRGNIVRLLNGEENKIGSKKKALN